MAELTADSGARQSVRTSFFFWMTVVMAGSIFVGFGISYFYPMATGTLTELHAIVHAHGFFYFSWMLLLMIQSGLVNRGNVALHRSLGMLGIAIGTAMVCFGTLVTLRFNAIALAENDPTIYGVNYISVVALAGFVALFFLAIRNIRDSAAHRRYILLATAIFLLAGLNRIFLALFNIGFESHLTYLWKYLTVDALIAAMLIYDWRTLGRPHQATLIGTTINVVPQLLHVPIVESGAFMGFSHWMATLV